MAERAEVLSVTETVFTSCQCLDCRVRYAMYWWHHERLYQGHQQERQAKEELSRIGRLIWLHVRRQERAERRVKGLREMTWS